MLQDAASCLLPCPVGICKVVTVTGHGQRTETHGSHYVDGRCEATMDQYPNLRAFSKTKACGRISYCDLFDR